MRAGGNLSATAMAPLNLRNIRDLLLNHITDCFVFDRLLRMGQQREFAQVVTALWMYLEQRMLTLGFHDLLAAVFIADEDLVDMYLAEAQLILHVIRRDIPTPPPDLLDVMLPLTCCELPPQPQSVGHLSFFYANRHAVSRGIQEVLTSVGRIVFDDTLRMLVFGDRNNPAIAARDSERGRTMLFTVYSGNPLTSEEIHHFFTVGWTIDCVECVVMEAATSSEVLLRGRVVFKAAAYLDAVLNDMQVTMFEIDDRLLLGYRPVN